MNGPSNIRELKAQILKLAGGSVTPQNVTEVLGLVTQYIYWTGEDGCVLLWEHGKRLTQGKAKKDAH